MRSHAASRLGRIGPLACALAIAGIAVGSARGTHASVPADTLYGTSWDRIVTIDQNDGSITDFAPQPGFRFFALAFDSAGRLFAAGLACMKPGHCIPPPYHVLMELDPLTGEVVGIIGPVTDVSGSPLYMHALSVQPETDVLFGFDYPSLSSPRIWTIDKSTAEATLVASEVPAGCGDNCSRNDAFAFAPDGTLYHTPGSPLVLMTLDPSTGAELTSLPIRLLPSNGGLAVRSDGTLFTAHFLFAQPCPTCPSIPPFSIFTTIDPLTGAVTDVGAGEGRVYDLDFSPLVVELVDIDIKPGNDLNAINSMSRGVIPVAILGSETFDTADIDVTTLAFGTDGAMPVHISGGHWEDLNDDGFTDLVSHFWCEETGIASGDQEVCVTGETLDGVPFKGCDAIMTRPQ